MLHSALVVIDNGSVLRPVHIALRNEGFLSVSIEDPEQAIEMLKMVSFDVVIADFDTLRRAGGEGHVSGVLSHLLHETRGAPLILGSLRPGVLEDLLDLTEPRAVAECAWKAINARHSTLAEAGVDASDADGPVYSHLATHGDRAGSRGLLIHSYK